MTAPSSQPKVLIIEDDAIIAHIYRSRLEREGYAVQLAADGQSGFFAIQTGQPDGVLLDLMLPKMNGIDVLKKIRAQADFKNLPIVVFTNAYVGTMVKEAVQAGATAVYDKATLTPRQIADALNAHIQRAAPAAAPVQSNQPVARVAPAMVVPASTSPPASVSTEGSLMDFFAHVPEQLTALRKVLQELSRAPDDAARQTKLGELYRQVHSLTGKAALAELGPMAQTASALEALVRELTEKPKSATPSTVRTVANAVDLLRDLCVPGMKAELASDPAIKILVVDDDMLARRAVVFALQKSFDKPEIAETGAAALALTASQAFDVIFLDVQMPGMNGFELCSKIRGTTLNAHTPVVFVTGQADFNARTQSTLSGGNDLIAKPFLFIEITVKALTFALRGRLQKMKQTSG